MVQIWDIKLGGKRGFTFQMDYWHGIPSMMFGAMGVLSGLLVLTQPETLGTKMPDTLAEAEALGRPESKLNPTS